MSIIRVTTGDIIDIAVSSARPGDKVVIEPGKWTQSIAINVAGTEDAHISIGPASVNDFGKVHFLNPNPLMPCVIFGKGSAYVDLFGMVIQGQKSKVMIGENKHYQECGILMANGGGHNCTVEYCDVYSHPHCGFKNMGHGANGERDFGIRYCRFYDNGIAGPGAIQDHGIYLAASYGATVTEVSCFGNTGAGIHAYSDKHPWCSTAHISRNRCYRNWTGILLGASTCDLEDNECAYNDMGLCLFRSQCHDNQLVHNFLGYNRINRFLDVTGGAPDRNEESNIFPTGQ